MPTALECLCCHEAEAVVRKMDEDSTKIICITKHDGFQPVCLDVWVLQTAYFNCRHRYGTGDMVHTVIE